MVATTFLFLMTTYIFILRCLIPNYDYLCSNCETVFVDIQLPIKDRLVPLAYPCPECQANGTIELMAAAPAMVDPMRIGRTNFSSSWTDKLAEMKSKHRHSTIKIPAPNRREI